MPIKTTPAAIFKSLNQIAPAIAFDVKFQPDPSFRWDGDGPDPRDDGYEPYDVAVSARTVVGGELREGIEWMGGHYEKPKDARPGRTTDLGGYLPQMLEEAVADLTKQGRMPASVGMQANKARKYLKEVMRVRYEEQKRSGNMRTRRPSRRSSRRSSRRR